MIVHYIWLVATHSDFKRCFIKTKFIKNLHQIIIFGLCIFIIILPIIGVMIIIKNYNVEKISKLIPFFLIIFLIIMYFLIGFYWIFQFVIFNENGITIKFLKKTIRFIRWNEIKSIEYGSVMRHPALIIKLFDGKNLNLDYRQSILRNIKKHVSKEKIK